MKKFTILFIIVMLNSLTSCCEWKLADEHIEFQFDMQSKRQDQKEVEPILLK